MRIFGFLKFYAVLLGLLFLLYSISPFDLGLRREILLFFAFTLLSPTLFKGVIHIRGVREGDVVLVAVKERDALGPYSYKALARAITSGRIGGVIEIQYEGKRASGEVLSYGGFFFPPEVNLLYYERIVNV